MPLTLIDAGPIIAYYDAGDRWHEHVQHFFAGFSGQFVTTCPVITEALWMLRANALVQNELLSDLSKGLYQTIPLIPADFSRIAELNIKYRSVPADFADLSLVAVSERLAIAHIVSMVSDFDIYQRFRKGKFRRVFPQRD